MEFSPIWRSLPIELVEQVFMHHVNAHFFTDPAYTWTQLRQLSGHQKRIVERHFRVYWLPRMSITLYASPSHRFEYGLDESVTTQQPATSAASLDGGRDDGAGVVIFAMQQQIHSPLAGISQDLGFGRFTRQYLRKVWDRYHPATHRNITVRLGEGVLSGGCRGGYILNDTHLLGLGMLESGKIRFEWKGAVNELLREEMYMRKVGERMFNNAVEGWLANNPRAPTTTDKQGRKFPPLKVQIGLWRSHVQAARRVAALNHRVAKSLDTTRPIQPNFYWASKWLHRQEPCDEPIEAIQRWLIGGCSRDQPPDIFEVAEVEESVVPMMEIFQTWVQRQPFNTDHQNGLEKDAHIDTVKSQTIIDLYRREFAWRAWIRCSGGDEQDDHGPDDDNEDEFIEQQRWTGLQVILLGNEKVRWVKPRW